MWTHRQKRIVDAHRTSADEHSIVARAEVTHELSRSRSGYGIAPGSGRYPTIRGGGHLQCDERIRRGHGSFELFDQEPGFAIGDEFHLDSVLA